MKLMRATVPRSMRQAVVALALSVILPAIASSDPGQDGEARISLDVKDAEITEIVRLLAEVGGFQVVIDPGVSCKLTLRLKEVHWPAALDVALRSCGLGRDEQDRIVRVAPMAKLTAEASEQRRLAEERRLNRPLRTIRYRLSYARAQELAPLIKRFLSPRGEVIYDTRTNTLIVTDIE